MERVVVLGGGFAGLWSAVGAARARDEFRIGRGDVTVTLINRDAWHAIRVRNYEPDLHDVKVALDDVLEPIAVERVAGEAVDIDFANRQVAYSIEGRHALPKLRPADLCPRQPAGPPEYSGAGAVRVRCRHL